MTQNPKNDPRETKTDTNSFWNLKTSIFGKLTSEKLRYYPLTQNPKNDPRETKTETNSFWNIKTCLFYSWEGSFHEFIYGKLISKTWFWKPAFYSDLLEKTNNCFLKFDFKDSKTKLLKVGFENQVSKSWFWKPSF